MVDRRLWLRALAVRLPLALTVGLGMAVGALVVAQAYCLSRVIARVFLEGQGLPEVSALLTTLLLIVLARGLATGGSAVAARHVAIRVKVDLREALFSHLLRLGPAHAWGERTGELTAVALDGVEALDAYFSQYLPQLALAALIPLTVLLAVFPLDPLSGLVLLLTAPLIPLFMVLIGRAGEALTRRQWGLLSRLSAHFLDVLQGLKTLKSLGRADDQAREIGRVSERYAHITLSVLRVTFLSALALELIATLSTAVVAVEVGLRLLYGRMAFADALFVLILAPEFHLPLRTLGARFHASMEGTAAAERIFSLLQIHPTIPPARGTTIPRLQEGIEIRDVRFSYEDEKRPALHGVSFRIGAGERIALVGPSGGGKSTLAALLLRFIAPQSGEIRVDGVPLSEIPVDGWRERVAWVPQFPHLFNDTLGANIRLARPSAPEAAVVRASRLAGLHDVVQSLPQGYETPLGEHGFRLSAGQGRRLALARAFLKDSPLLVLDEPSVHLDPGTEEALEATLARLLRNRTALIIAHRLPTAIQADRIVLLASGAVVQEGRHPELLAADGLYSRLVNTYGAAA